MKPPAWLPNAISGLRILMVPAWLLVAHLYRQSVLAEASDSGLRIAVFAILVALGFSDVLDGWIARRFELTSNLGAILDAVADKLAQIAVYTYLALLGAPAFSPVPLWFLAVLILRDAALAIGFLVIRHRRGSADATHFWHGKLSSVLLFLLMLWLGSGAWAEYLIYAFGTVAALVGASTLHYVVVGIRQLQSDG